MLRLDRRRLAVLILLSLLGAACDQSPATSPTPPAPPPAPPVQQPVPLVSAGTVLRSPDGVGLAAATTFLFFAPSFASSDNSRLLYNWTFGDGGDAIGDFTVTHQFARAGAFEVRVTATNSAGQSASAAVPITIGTLTGGWEAVIPRLAGFPIPFDLTQNGATLHGTGMYGEDRMDVSGGVLDPRTVNILWSVQPRQGGLPYVWSLAGIADAQLNEVPITLSGVSICPCPGSLRRRR